MVEIEIEFPEKNNKVRKIDDICGDRNIFIRECFDRAEALYEIVVNNYDIDELPMEEKAKDELYWAFIGFDLELYLKTLLYINKNDSELIKGYHNLREYFSQLEEEQKKSIQEQCQIVNEQEFDKNLENIKNVFNDFRYGYELNGYNIELGFLCKMLKSLKTIAIKEMQQLNKEYSE